MPTREHCPSCGSSACSSDYDRDCGVFWTCRNCDHQWSYPQPSRPEDPVEFLAWLADREPLSEMERGEIRELANHE